MATGDGGELNKSAFGFDTSDPNNSLLKKVTKRVSGLFPSSLTKWFGPSDGQQSVVRRRESIDDDDDDDETAQVQQPPKKRAKPSSDAEFSPSNSFTITSTPLLNSRSDHRHLQPGPSGYTRHSTVSATTSVNYEASSTQNAVTVTNGDDKSDSGDSTSGYSSVQPQLHKESSFISDRGNTLNQPSTSKTSPNKSFNASMNSSRSLFSEQSLNPQRQCMSARRPSFSASTFGSPSFVDRTLSTKRAVNSPFYGGRTTYGGASAYRRNRIIFPRDETNNITIKKSVDIKPVNEASSSNDSVNLSKTARRILDTLEHFSTPVLDAKKIPNINRQSCDASKSAQQRRAPYSRENKSVPNKELLVPTVPDLIKMKLKERLQESTVQVRKVATSSKSVLNTEYSIRTVEESSKPQKHVSKMKTKVVSVRGRKDDMDDIVDAVKLPEVKLPITNLPKFDFTLPPPATVVTKPAPTEIKKPNISAPATKPIESLKSFSAQFNFAKPIIVSEKPKSVTSMNSFTFSEPINAKSSATTNLSAPTITFKASTSTAPRRKESPKNNRQNHVGFSLQPPNQFVTGSVMDILGKTEKKPESDNLMDKFKPAAGTWECSACMVRNIPSATRCLACETIKETPKKVEEQSYGFGNKFKMSSDKWECPACMIRNNDADIKCVACTTPKPGATPAALPTAPAASTSNSFSGFGDKFKPATDTWECAACMVRNKCEAAKCIACETPKPGTKSETKSSLTMPFDAKTNNSGFGDLIKKQQSNWECPSCMVRNPSEKKTCACCEAPKPGEQQEFKFGTQPTGGPQFKFGINNSAPSSGFNIDVKSVAPTTTFSFGIKPADKTTDAKTTTNNGPTPVTTGFTFGVPPASKTETKNESPAKPAFSESSSLPSANKPIAFGTPTVPAAELNKSATFKFDSPVTTSSTNIFSSSTSTTPTTINSSYSFSVPSSITHTTPSKPTFSFGGSSTTATSMSSPILISSIACIKSVPSNNIFGNAATSAPTTQTTAISFGVSTTAAVTTAATATTAGSTFSFRAPTNAKPSTFGSENKIPVPQFNFGAGGIPFNAVYPTPKTTVATTTTPPVNFGNTTTATTAFSSVNNKSTNKTETPAFGASNNQPSFSFNAGTNVTNNNKSEVKPFAFSGSGEPVAKVPAFSFSQNDTPAAAPLAKAPIFNFGASASNASNSAVVTAAPAANMFSFNPNKSEKSATFGSGSSTVFGDSAQPSTTPQNGGFNFGASSAPLNFNFGGGTNPPTSPTPAMFGFGSSQAGSGSAAAAPAPAPAASAAGIFAFGGGAPAQQQTPTFSPDIKPNFNFTGGSLPTFSAQSAPSTGAIPQRKIRKAVRRTQPR